MIVVIFKLKKEEWDECHVFKCDRVTSYKDEILILEGIDDSLKIIDYDDICSLYIYYSVVDEVKKWI